MFEEMVTRVVRGVERGQIPAGQYQAVLIDEGHDFEAEWLKLAAQMVDPATNSLLVMYDDAQSIYQRRRAQPFSFKRLGIQALGRHGRDLPPPHRDGALRGHPAPSPAAA